MDVESAHRIGMEGGKTSNKRESSTPLILVGKYDCITFEVSLSSGVCCKHAFNTGLFFAVLKSDKQ